MLIIGNAFPSLIGFNDKWSKERFIAKRLKEFGSVTTTHAEIDYHELRGFLAGLLAEAARFELAMPYLVLSPQTSSIDAAKPRPVALPAGTEDDDEMILHLIDATAGDPDDSTETGENSGDSVLPG
jgi:hypothetical protein